MAQKPIPFIKFKTYCWLTTYVYECVYFKSIIVIHPFELAPLLKILKGCFVNAMYLICILKNKYSNFLRELNDYDTRFL